MSALKQCIPALVDFLLPPACAFCTTPLTIDETHDQVRLCQTCRNNFTRDDRPACLKCGMPTGPYVDTSDGCIACRRRNFRFETVVRLGTYEDELRTACIRGKAPGAEALAAALAGLLYEKQRERFEDFAPDVVVPVPQHWLHQFTRPHHQANTIAQELARRLDIPYLETAICKLRRTADQSSLPRSKRLKNLTQAFHVADPKQVSKRRILVVDDIFTTGTTLNEVARTASKAGASSVAASVIASVP